MKRLITAALVAGLAVAFLVSPASAHNVLLSTTPAAGSSISTGPSTVVFNFNAPVQFGDNTIAVIGPNGTHWEKSSKATVSGDTVSAPVVPLGPAGVYTASYHVISADGHPVQGDITFRLAKAGTGTPVTVAAAASSGGGIPVWVWIVVALVVLGGGVFFALRTSRRKEESVS
ncbi:MAG TPA: copper resistance CopC family protein [Pseudonocardiaceae bacterium]|nr:copper resistance CopC family protein [Pseudonocardiaceae bacterium]